MRSDTASHAAARWRLRAATWTADFGLIGRLIEQAREAGAGLLALPEACLGGYLSHLEGTQGRAGRGPPALDPDGPEIGGWPHWPGTWWSCAGYCEADGRRTGTTARSA